jgi:hypothetical protein
LPHPTLLRILGRLLHALLLLQVGDFDDAAAISLVSILVELVLVLASLDKVVEIAEIEVSNQI